MEELESMNNKLHSALSALADTSGKSDLQNRKKILASLIKVHVQQIKNIVISRRRRQKRSQRRNQLMQRYFMSQMEQFQLNYMQMYSILLKKYSHQREEEEEEIATTTCDNNSRCTSPSEIYKNDFSTDEKSLKSLHVTSRTYQWLCVQLGPTLRNVVERNVDSPLISPNRCVALGLYFLASGERLSIISQEFGFPRPTIIKCLKIFCNAVMTCLGKALQMVPQSDADCTNVVEGFHQKTNMPPALVGIAGVCSIPKRGKQEDSLVRMEYLLDDRMLFRELRLSDGTKPPLPGMFSEPPNPLTQLPKRRINKRLVAPFVLTPVHQNFPLRPWLLQRYLDPIAPHEYDFNEVAVHLHDLSDVALQRLMSRWRFLSQPLDISFHTASCIITAACVLHNVLEELLEPHLSEWNHNVDLSRLKPAPCIPKPDTCVEAEHALEVRDFLARTISSTEM